MGLAGAALGLLLHVEFVDDDLEDVELFCFQISKQLFIRLIRFIQLASPLIQDWPVPVLVELIQEAISTILQSNDLLGLELPQVVLVAGFLRRVVALIHHVRVVHAIRPDNFDLIHFLLLFEDLVGSVSVA